MRAIVRRLTQLYINSNTQTAKLQNPLPLLTFEKPFSSRVDGGEDWTANFGGTRSSAPEPLGWDAGPSSWFTGLTKEHFDGEVVGKKVAPDDPSSLPRTQRGGYSDARWTDDELARIRQLDAANRWGKGFVESWDDRMNETALLMKQGREPGARGLYLKDSEKAEMYRKHKENPEVYTVERLAKDYGIMRQRVHAILWLKELEEEEVKKHGELDDSVETLLDTFPEFFVSHEREFHVASLPYKPDFKVMPEGWDDGTTQDPDEVLYQISSKEDEMLYQEFVRKMNFNKMMMAKKVKCRKYSKRRPSQGSDFMVEKVGPRGKRGDGGGSSRPLNHLEKLFMKRETPQRRRKILP